MLRPKGFTLIELLVVIAMVAFLLSIVMPSLEQINDGYAMKLCGSNVRQIMFGLINAGENNAGVPRSTTLIEDIPLENSWVCLPVSPNMELTGKFAITKVDTV